MQTVAVEIQDNYMPQFMSYIEEHNLNLSIVKDENLEYDPYFYERKKELKHVIDECENGTMEMLSQEQYNDEMKIFFDDLRANANI